MSNDVAILLDLDNAVIGAAEAQVTFDIKLVLEYIHKITGGRVVFRRAYGDWRQHPNMPKMLASAGFELQSTVNQINKNLADMQMVIDAMDTLVEGREFSTYVLVTGDRDFMPLVQALRKRGKVVIGVGVKHTSSKSLASLCDKFVYYEDLVGNVSLPDQQIISLLKKATAEVLKDRDQMPASALKQMMQTLSEGGFNQTKYGKMSFTKFLEQFPEIVSLVKTETTVFVRMPESAKPEIVKVEATKPEIAKPEPVKVEMPAPEPLPAQPFSEEEVVQLLEQALNNLLLPTNGEPVRASVLKEELRSLSQGKFDEAQQGFKNFAALLKRYPQIVDLQQKGTTLYVIRPSVSQPVTEQMELNREYRRLLKQQGLRVVPAKTRLILLRQLVNLLQTHSELQWRQIIDTIYENQDNKSDEPISRSLIQDLLRLADEAKVILINNGNRTFYTAAPVRLLLISNRAFQDAVMHCDAVYLNALKKSPVTFDIDEAAIALYDTPSYARYLKVVLSHLGEKGK